MLKPYPELPPHYMCSREVSQAIRWGQPVVALESAVISHGLPQPDNLQLAIDMEEVIRSQGAIPATIAIIRGQVHIGLTRTELEEFAALKSSTRKISRRDFGIAIAQKENGGTTVAGTIIAARAAGILVFATGGIGGVHRGDPFDISADLLEISNSKILVVCAGAKAILDLPATVEVLETYGVPIIGYQTMEFPAFYSISSGLTVNCRVEDAKEIAEIAHSHWSSGLNSGILVVQPPPENTALPKQSMEFWIQQATQETRTKNIHGASVTPYLLNRISELSDGLSKKTNLSLLHNNARLAARVAMVLQEGGNIPPTS